MATSQTLTGTSIQSPGVAAVLLAAGCSNRYGEDNKLLQQLDGLPILHHAVGAILSSVIETCIVVTGHESEQVQMSVAGYPVLVTHNPHYLRGISSSIKAGVQAISTDHDAVIIVLADMPDIDASVINKLIACFDPAAKQQICVPTYGQKRGNPVLWSKDFFAELCQLEGNIGGKQLMDRYEQFVKECPCDSTAIFRDIDTSEQLRLRQTEKK